MLAPVEAEPVDIALDGVDVFLLLLGRIGVVEAQIALAAELLGDAEIQADGLGVSDMEIAVGLRRKPGDDLAGAAAGEIGLDDVANEVATCLCGFGCGHCSQTSSNLCNTSRPRGRASSNGARMERGEIRDRPPVFPLRSNAG